ncbi:MAG: hypothetical protein HQM08_20465 [Candidatus Riflebacteria bacterium]|nr:hypothetical protein [Candidatus Riflebacteria bacterium]
MKFRRICRIFIFLFSCTAFQAVAEGNKAIFIDSRLLLLVHPLLKQFDWGTHRFLDTPSEPISGGEPAFQELNMAIKKMSNELTILSKKYSVLISNSKSSAEKNSLSKKFFNEKNELENKIETAKKRINLDAREVPGRLGLTTIYSIFPQVTEVSNNIRAVYKKLKEIYPNILILDISGLLPAFPPRIENSVLFKNCHFSFWNKPTSNKDLQAYKWLANAKEYWLQNTDFINPIPFGAEDARFKAVEIMNSITNR